MNNLQINSNNSEGNNMSAIQEIFQSFIDNGGEPKVTAFKKHLNNLINDDIKPYCNKSGKSAGDDWRSELKSMFGGRGKKWVFVSLTEIEPTLQAFENQNIDCTNYRSFTTKANKAWIRFSGPRVNNGQQCAAFEVRTESSTIDHPKQLHYIPVSMLEGNIETMPGTPHSLKLEQDSAPKPNKPKAPKEVFIKKDSVLKAMADEINNELAEEVVLNEPPQSDDPADWEAFLQAEGLTQFEDDLDFNL